MARKKPCDYCEQENYIEPWLDGVEMNRPWHSITAELYPFNGHMTFISQAENPSGETGELWVEIPMNYCPNCGRKLTDD